MPLGAELSVVSGPSLRNPWVFTAVNAVVWALVWGGITLVLFGDGVFTAAVEAGLVGVAFSALYLYLGRERAQNSP